jgi:tetratricopeptide (TPR) repeat protein
LNTVSNSQNANNGQGQQLNNRGEIQGVFSTKSISKVGTGSTQRKSIQKSYWMAAEQEGGQIEVQPLNTNYVPSGPKRTVPKDEFLEKFSPEPEFYVSTVYPKMRELQKTVARADRHRKQGETFSAEYEYNNALKVDEENIRANFGIGLTYLDRGDKDKADDIFQRLVKLNAAFEEEHKHLFNDFGISLRKNGMLDQCLEYYTRALELTEEDEHLYHNIARVYYEKGDMKGAATNLKKALELNPEFEEGKRFLQFLKKKKQT